MLGITLETTLRILLLLFVALAYDSAGGQANAQTACATTPCKLGRVLHVSLTPKDYIAFIGPVESITVLTNAGTYVLSCSRAEDKGCIAPTAGKQYEFIDKGDSWDSAKELVGEYENRQTVYLRLAPKKLGAYYVEAFAPISDGDVLKAIESCEAENQFLHQKECVTWLNKKRKANSATCPDPDARVSCRSFQELVTADDKDLLDDFATKNVYACFRPNQDFFFEIWFSYPDGVWREAQESDIQAGGLAGTITVFGSAGLNAYVAGVWDENQSMEVWGRWSHLALDKREDRSSITIDRATFASGPKDKTQISITNSRFVASEKYQNKAGAETLHTITLQFANGRYSETFESQGKTLDTISGRCLNLSPTHP